MIVWTGGGVLALLFWGLGVGAGSAAASALGGSDSTQTMCIGIACLFFGFASYLVGKWFNITRPSRQAEQRLADYQQELLGRVQAGAFQAAPGVPAPRSVEEAQQQVGSLVERERARLQRGLRNRHTMFWIPMQYWGMLQVIGGGVMIVVAITRVAS
ncbi:transcriptional accessory protein [Actinomyces sp. 432]|uniref:transcriptional accessory protein n=1 Tax=Actinomyces sp. 432 TaxID=2057798 RepID=UPI00137AA4C5|nr:transcriptional accessory protein [Actinomyces sp. 432]